MLEFVPLLLPLVLLAVGFVTGRITEARHYRSIHEREQRWHGIPATTTRVPFELPVERSELVVGSVVISVDYMKRFLAGLRMLFGGELHAYSSLLDRARREATLRMKESCPSAHLFANCRLETATISSGANNALGTVEVTAYATAIIFRREGAAA
jgi:uncharacterized protein YbjQ (UPF0145 family)